MGRLLALDIATSTGWAELDLDTGEVLGYGQIDSSSDSTAPYPYSILDKAGHTAQALLLLIATKKPTKIVIEDTNIGGRAGQSSQRHLEWIHCLFLYQLARDVPVTYMKSDGKDGWKTAVGVALSADDRANNKKLAQVRAALKKKLGRKWTAKELSDAKAAAGIEGKRTIKHASQRWCREVLGIDLGPSQADAADALGLAKGFIKLRNK